MSHSILKLSKPNKFETSPKDIKNFFINQIKEDQQSVFKKKEILFIGRSNVGKSALINKVFNEKICKVSKKPGSTKKFYFHELNNNQGMVIDAPGYGYADVNVRAKRYWQGMIFDYLKISTRVSRLFLLINSEHGLKTNDLAFILKAQQYKLNIQIVLTKSDKIKDSQIFDRILAIGQQLKKYDHISPVVHATSSETGFGIDHLRYCLTQSLLDYEPRNVKGQEELLLKYLLEQYKPKGQYLDKRTYDNLEKLETRKATLIGKSQRILKLGQKSQKRIIIKPKQKQEDNTQ